ncbi:MAG: TetR/AcrR family transcriptional regulator [Thiohalocapsa sp. PB-PSB1]|jgi:TetR/AcrR family transcriptional repressor of mexJK operon|nr:MAG: TetR/AcrR family transcriptional regulator [Thiohalocapsa sp. PB-PSB1]HCS91887.1 hypothetical protein [Chromatiaceae bacterium]
MGDNDAATSAVGSVARAGRPKSAEKARAVLEAASQLFLQQGLQGTSMDAVARAAGVSKQTVYGHFDNKESLFRACIRSKIEDHGFQIKEASADVSDARSTLLVLCRRFMALKCDPEVVAMFRVVAAEAATQPRIAGLFFESGPGGARDAIAQVLDQLVAAGQLRPHDIDHASWELMNMSAGSFHLRLLFGLLETIETTELEAHLARIVDDFLAIYRC